MDWDFTVTIESMIVGITAIVAVYELHRSRRKDYYEIDQENRRDYARILENRKGIEHYYSIPDIDLAKLKNKKPQDYKKIIASEIEYFRFVHNCWKAGHIDKSIPRYLRKQWDEGPEKGMRNTIHLQSWRQIISKMDFIEKEKFVKFIEHQVQKINK